MSRFRWFLFGALVFLVNATAIATVDVLLLTNVKLLESPFTVIFTAVNVGIAWFAGGFIEYSAQRVRKYGVPDS